MQNNIPNNTIQKGNDQVYAGFFVRLAAYLIDWLIVGAALMVVRIPMWIASLVSGGEVLFKDFIFTYSAYDILIYVLKVGYFTAMTYVTGATVGKRLMQIKVVGSEGHKPTLFEIFFRESVGKFLSGLVMYVGYIIIGADKEKKALHDILSDTRVVYYHRKTVMVPAPIEYQTMRFAYQPAQNMPQGDGNMQDIQSRYQQPPMGMYQSMENQQPMQSPEAEMNSSVEVQKAETDGFHSMNEQEPTETVDSNAFQPMKKEETTQFSEDEE